MNRHILDLHASDDRVRYERLMGDLAFYRLALGQSNQTEYLNKIRDNLFVTADVARAMMLCFFPISEQNFKKKSEDICLDDRKIRLLINDAIEYLATISVSEELKKHVLETCQSLELECDDQKQIRSDSIYDKVEMLYYFVHPHDGMYDLTPQKGFDDDLARFLEKKVS